MRCGDRTLNYLFAHQNFPGQYLRLIAHLREDPANRIVFLSQKNANRMRGVEKIEYSEKTKVASSKAHPWAQHFDNAMLNAALAARAAERLKQTGFTPDVILGHAGWGETFFLKDVWPSVPVLAYFEWFEQPRGAAMNFDPEFKRWVEDPHHARGLNAIQWVGLDSADAGQTPTEWQLAQYPDVFRERVRVVHEGVDTNECSPGPGARVRVSDRLTLSAADEVVTYCSRNLEPLRGFHIFMRALPELQRRRPDCHTVIVGQTGVGYSRPAQGFPNYLAMMKAELGDRLDWSRIHLTGRIPMAQLVDVFRISRAHVYLTYPFVLSWSMLQAMAAGCVVVGSATPPVEEAIRHGENGFLVDFFSPEAVTEAVIRVLEAPDGNAAVRAAARRTIVEGYDAASVCLPQLLDYVGDLIRR